MPILRILSTLAFASTLDALRPGFEAAHGVKLDTLLLPTALLLPRVETGERGDLVLLTEAGLDRLASGTIDAGSRRTVAVSSVGLAVPAGAPHPALETVDDVVAALGAARAIAVSRAGASGLYFDALIDRLGIGAAVRAKSTVIDSGFTAELLRDGRADLAVQQISELLAVPGIEVVGPLPPGLGAETVFGGAVFTGAAHPGPAAALLAAMAEARDTLRQLGLAPA